MPWYLLVLEEYADLTTSRKQEIETHLQRLAQKARACGIHVIVSTQKPSADVLSTTVRSNLGAQLAFRVKDAVNSRIILGEAGAETLGGKGDALFKSVSGGLIRFQCALKTQS
jgi:DNA phosphorothioation-dependent restriction protein DptH